MAEGYKLAVVSGSRMDQGKSTIVDNLIAPRLENLVRFEIESLSTGSQKAGITKIKGCELQILRRSLLILPDTHNFVCDVGGSEFVNFMAEMLRYKSTAGEFDRILFVMRSTGIKEGDSLASIAELIEMGAHPDKVSVIFNFELFTVGLAEMRRNLRARFAKVFAGADEYGFQVCQTPIVNAELLYKAVFNSPDWTVDGLANAPNFRIKIKELVAGGKEVPEALFVLEALQEQARSFGKANLDAVWAEIMAASQGVK